jgi:hypothetical protein
MLGSREAAARGGCGRGAPRRVDVPGARSYVKARRDEAGVRPCKSVRTGRRVRGRGTWTRRRRQGRGRRRDPWTVDSRTGARGRDNGDAWSVACADVGAREVRRGACGRGAHRRGWCRGIASRSRGVGREEGAKGLPHPDAAFIPFSRFPPFPTFFIRFCVV